MPSQYSPESESLHDGFQKNNKCDVFYCYLKLKYN